MVNTEGCEEDFWKWSEAKMLEEYKREYCSTIVGSLKVSKVQPELLDLYALFHYLISLSP